MAQMPTPAELQSNRLGAGASARRVLSATSFETSRTAPSMDVSAGAPLPSPPPKTSGGPPP
eukprot:15362624-Alexandrium_andersonii.AAC.1